MKKRSSGHQILKNWVKAELGSKAKPIVEDGVCKVAFAFKAAGHYQLECHLMADDSIGIVSLSAWARLGIPQKKEKKILKLCSEKSSDNGIFVVQDGALVYIHSRSSETTLAGGELISQMIACMDESVAAVAEGVVAILGS